MGMIFTKLVLPHTFYHPSPTKRGGGGGGKLPRRWYKEKELGHFISRYV